MKIRFLGTAAAEGIPALFCKCNTCRIARERGGKNIRTRSQAIIDGKLLIDFPADTYFHAITHGIELSDIEHCIITHSHSDHLYPNDIVMRIPGNTAHGNKSNLNFYGSAGVMLKIGGYLHSIREKIDDYASINPIEPYAPYKIGEYTVTALEARHDVTSHPLVYIISDGSGKSLLYGHDTGYFLPKVWEYLEKEKPYFSFVSLDCTAANIPEMGYNSHMNLNDNVKVRERLVSIGCADSKTVFCSNHFSHNGKDVLYEEFSALAKQNGFLTSYDGFEIEF